MKKNYLFKANHLSGVLFILLLVAFSAPVRATNYYVDATKGNDSNNGISKATAWKTLSKVSASAFSPGDSILFKRGEMWRGTLKVNESGTSSSPIVFGAYGEGKKPLFLQSITKNNTSDWTSIASNQWATANGSFPSDVGFMLLGEERADNVGIRRERSVPIDHDKEYWYDGTNKRVILYCTQNPASEYSSIEISYTTNIYQHFIGTSNSYLHFENLDIRYFNSHAMAFTNTRGIEVRHCHISYGGGCHRASDRYGNGVEFWLSSSDCIVENCRVGQIYDSGVTHQASSNAATVDNIKFRNNILYGNGMAAYEIGFFNSSTNLSDLNFYDNICLGSGYGWSQYQRPEVYIGWDICTWKSRVGSWDGLYVNNNIFYEPNSFVMYFDVQTRPSNYKQDYNYFYKSTGIRPSLIYYTYSNRYLMEEFPKYQSDKGQDLNSGWGSRSEAQKKAREKVSCEDLFFLNTLFQEYDDSTLTGKAPSVFDLVSPADGSSVNGQAVLSWEASTGNTSPVDHYEVWIDCERVATVPVGTNQYNASLSDGAHNWFVIAVCKDGDYWRQSTTNNTFSVDDNGILSYSLVVESGTGSGNYTEEDTISITPDILTGKTFKEWTGDIEYLISSVTTANNKVAMPAKGITLTAIYENVLYTLTVEHGSGSGSEYIYGQVVEIIADQAPEGHEFDRWTGDVDYISDVSDSTTSVTMPASNVTVTATYAASKDDNTTSAEMAIAKNSFYVLPNPANSDLTIHVLRSINGKANVIIYNQIGEQVHRSTDVVTFPYQVDASSYPAGIYLVKVSDGDYHEIVKIIKK